MKLDLSDIQANVHHETDKGILIIKVGFPSVGLWMNSWTARISPKYPGKGWWIQPPAVKTGKGWRKILEFRNDSPLLEFIDDEIRRAIDRWQNEKVVPLDGELLEGKERQDADNVFPQ